MNTRPSVMSHDFSTVPDVRMQRSSFNRSHGCKTTFDAGYLVPFYADEALPGDTFSLNASVFARVLSAIKTPVVDNFTITTFFFAVPLRLLQTNFVRLMGERTPDPDSSIDFLVPQMVAPTVTGYTIGSLSDYLGIPTGVASLTHASYWHRAYSLIWNEWFRSEDLQDSVVVDRDDGPDAPADYVLLRRGKRHDYFTSALPLPQKGDAVTIPLGGTIPVLRVDNANAVRLYQGGNNVQWAADGTLSANAGYIINPSAQQISIDPNGSLVGDLSQATQILVNTFREAFMTQVFLERDARGGTRYTEITNSHFGVTSPDARLQRPEYLGGSSQPISVTSVPQTSSVASQPTAPGTLSAYGSSASSGHGFKKSFVEHSVILGLVCVDADLNYQQGLNRMFSRLSRYDFYWPSFANLGEQAILSKEIYATGVPGTSVGQDDRVFGYQERYAEYRYKPSIITGKLRSQASGSLDIWHLAEEFSAQPSLNASFIQSNPPMDRIVAVDTEPHFVFDSYIQLTTARPMPVNSVPMSLGRF